MIGTPALTKIPNVFENLLRILSLIIFPKIGTLKSNLSLNNFPVSVKNNSHIDIIETVDINKTEKILDCNHSPKLTINTV